MNERKPVQAIHEERLCEVGGYVDVLSTFPDSIKIQTLDSHLNVVGEVEMVVSGIPGQEDIDSVKGFYAQGQAVAQRKMASVRQIFESLSSPVFITGVGEDQKPS